MTFVKGQPKTPGSGRKMGVKNKLTEAMERAARELGPFDGDSVAFMTMIYKHKDLPLGVRMQAANSIVNFEWPRLSQVDMTHRSLDSMRDEAFFRAWDKLEAFLAQHGRPKLLESADSPPDEAGRDTTATCEK